MPIEPSFEVDFSDYPEIIDGWLVLKTWDGERFTFELMVSTTHVLPPKRTEALREALRLRVERASLALAKFLLGFCVESECTVWVNVGFYCEEEAYDDRDRSRRN